MSVKNVEAFFEQVAGDKALQSKLKALDRKVEESIIELAKIAAAEGFEFTPEDFAKARSKKRKISAREFRKVKGRSGGPVISPMAFSKLCLCEFPNNSY